MPAPVRSWHYTTVGFDMVVIVEDVNGDTKVAKLCGYYTFNQHNDASQTEVIKATSFAGVPNGYVGVYDDGTAKFIPIDTSTQFVVTNLQQQYERCPNLAELIE